MSSHIETVRHTKPSLTQSLSTGVMVGESRKDITCRDLNPWSLDPVSSALTTSSLRPPGDNDNDYSYDNNHNECHIHMHISVHFITVN